MSTTALFITPSKETKNLRGWWNACTCRAWYVGMLALQRDQKFNPILFSRWPPTKQLWNVRWTRFEPTTTGWGPTPRRWSRKSGSCQLPMLVRRQPIVNFPVSWSGVIFIEKELCYYEILDQIFEPLGLIQLIDFYTWSRTVNAEWK